MKIEGYEEISEEEYYKLPNDEGSFFEDAGTEKIRYFKKAQKFPICFEDENYTMKIDETSLEITHKYNGRSFLFMWKRSFPLLVKAVEKAKEVAKKNEN